MFQAYFWFKFLFFCVLQKKKEERKKDPSFQVIPITKDEEGVIFTFLREK